MGYDLDKIYPPIRKKFLCPPPTAFSASDWLEIGKKAGWVYNDENDIEFMGAYTAGYGVGFTAYTAGVGGSGLPGDTRKVDPMSVSDFFDIFNGKAIECIKYPS